MSKQPSHLVSLMCYCHKCKSTNIVTHPQESVEWNAEHSMEGDQNKGKLVMRLACPSCRKDLDIILKSWETTDTT